MTMNMLSSASTKLYLGSDQFDSNNEAHTGNPLKDVREASVLEEVTSVVLHGENYVFPFSTETDTWFQNNVPYHTVEIKNQYGQYEQPYWLQAVYFDRLPHDLKIRLLQSEVINRITCHIDIPTLFKLALSVYCCEDNLIAKLVNLIEVLTVGPYEFDVTQLRLYRIPKTKLKFQSQLLVLWGTPAVFNAIDFIDNNPGFLSPLGTVLSSIVTDLNLHEIHSQLNGNNGEHTNDDDLDHVRRPRWHNIVNRGAARRGGNARGPFLPGDRRHVPNALNIAHNINVPQNNLNPQIIRNIEGDRQAPWWTTRNKEIQSQFLCSACPNVKTLWGLHELECIDEHTTLLDPLGSPFCGLTAIDLAVKTKPNVYDYLQRCKVMQTPYSLGTNVYLRNYAHSRGCNLRIYRPVEIENIIQLNNVLDYMNNPTWEWIVIFVKNADGSIPDHVDQGDVIKHCFLAIDNRADSSKMELPLIKTSYQVFYQVLFTAFCSCLLSYYFYKFLHAFVAILVSFGWALYFPSYKADFNFIYNIANYFSFLTMFADEIFITYNIISNIRIDTAYSFIEYRFNVDNSDVRNIKERRDKLESQDHYAVLNKGWGLFVKGKFCFYFDLGLGCRKLISVVRANQLLKDMQALDDPSMSVAMLSVMKTGTINTLSSIPTLYVDTMEYCKYYTKHAKLDLEIVDMLTVAYNSSGMGSFVDKLNIVSLNQLAVVVGDSIYTSVEGVIGFSHLLLSGTNNGFKKFSSKNLSPKPRRVVSYAPFGSLITTRGQLGPGNLCVTEPHSLIAALTGRSMVKLPVDLQEFRDFCLTKIDTFINDFDFEGHISEDPIENFVANNTGKRSKKYIDNKVKEFIDFKNGKYSHKYLKNSCFVKFEDSTKVVDGVSRPRPRLIMTMSDYNSMVLSPLVTLVHKWNQGWIKDYQVKNLNPDEFVSRIARFCERDHIVTDYSAFESSVSGFIKNIEVVFVRKLLQKMGMNKTCRHYLRFDVRHRKLSTKFGEFVISSRCSGDYLTSTLNCLINYLINLYSAHKNGFTKAQLLVEGDDGITLPCQIDSKVINSLGFGFSSNLKGSNPGDVDFLRVRWTHDGPLVNIGRSLKKLLWVDSQQILSDRKQKTILRAKALSYYFSSPGCPILTSVLNFILHKTAGLNYFKGLEIHLNSYNAKNSDFDVKKIGRNYGTLMVKETLRSYVHAGAEGFPPIPVVVQLLLEKNFAKGNFYVGSLLDDYEDIFNASLSQDWKHSDLPSSVSQEMSSVLNILNSDKEGLAEIAKQLNPDLAGSIDIFMEENDK